MSNTWSTNKYVNILVYFLIYLMSMNFLHYGQLILPVICFILFVDRKCKFYVNDIKTFVVLCLFAISFCAFSYKLGFYCVMGFCLPMAYYIGSNINNSNEENIKSIIYIICFGMVTHYLLNFVYEVYRFGWYKTITKATRYDIWLQDEFVPTGTATNAVIILSIAYYLFVYENDRNLNVFGLVLLVLTAIYTVILRRRIQLGLFVLIFIISILLDVYCNKKTDVLKRLNIFFKVIISIASILILMYILNIPGFRRWVNVNSIFAYFKSNGFNNGRLDIFIKGLSYAPNYLWGGQKISTIVGMPFHDLLFNVFDYAGIITTLLMSFYLVLSIKPLLGIIKSRAMKFDFKLLIIEIVLGYIIMFFLEPLMTGSSIFLICGIILMASFEKLIK